jgi:hypothetical protein
VSLLMSFEVWFLMANDALLNGIVNGVINIYNPLTIPATVAIIAGSILLIQVHSLVLIWCW